MGKTGLLHNKVIKHKHGEVLYSQFIHLSVQEILAMVNILQSDRKALKETLAHMSKSGRFNMAHLFLTGLTLDSENEWIAALSWAAGYRKVKLLDLTGSTQKEYLSFVYWRSLHFKAVSSIVERIGVKVQSLREGLKNWVIMTYLRVTREKWSGWYFFVNFDVVKDRHQWSAAISEKRRYLLA